MQQAEKRYVKLDPDASAMMQENFDQKLEVLMNKWRAYSKLAQAMDHDQIILELAKLQQKPRSANTHLKTQLLNDLMNAWISYLCDLANSGTPVEDLPDSP